MTSFVCVFLDDSFEAHVLHHLHRLEQMMTEANADQAHLEADVTALANVLDELAGEIATLKSQPPEQMDFTSADALVAKAQGLVAAGTPVPGNAPPVVPSDAPPVDVTPPSDGSDAPAATDTTGTAPTEPAPADDGTTPADVTPSA